MANQGAIKNEEYKAGVNRRIIQVVLTLAIQIFLLVVSSGRVDWPGMWLFTGLYLVGILANAVLMFRLNPEAIAERSKAGGQKGWDRVVGGLWALMYFFAVLIVAGLDVRFSWSGPSPAWLQLLGGLVFAIGLGIFSWGMITNAYFATVVRIQTERGHQVCQEGPYRLVRHPGYVGAILQSLGVPLILGSTYALIPGVLAALLMVLRTALEDRTLRAELPGYAAYSAKVRYRLIPGVW
jgi:protein-S-isoprenylcysteine O-methyltransferase Ste14